MTQVSMFGSTLATIEFLLDNNNLQEYRMSPVYSAKYSSNLKHSIFGMR